MKINNLFALVLLLVTACSTAASNKSSLSWNANEPTVNRNPAAMDQLSESEANAMSQEELSVREKLYEISKHLPTSKSFCSRHPDESAALYSVGVPFVTDSGIPMSASLQVNCGSK